MARSRLACLAAALLAALFPAAHAAAPAYTEPSALFMDMYKLIDEKVGAPPEKNTDSTGRQAQAIANSFKGRIVRFTTTYEDIGRSGVLYLKDLKGPAWKGQRAKFSGELRVVASDKNAWTSVKKGEKVTYEARVDLTVTHTKTRAWELIINLHQARPVK